MKHIELRKSTIKTPKPKLKPRSPKPSAAASLDALLAAANLGTVPDRIKDEEWTVAELAALSETCIFTTSKKLKAAKAAGRADWRMARVNGGRPVPVWRVS